MARTVEGLSVFLQEAFDFLPDDPYKNITGPPKVCITTSSKPSENTHLFAKSLVSFIPNSLYDPLKSKIPLNRMANIYSEKGYSHLIVLFQNQKKIRYMAIGFLFIENPVFLTFRISNIILSKHIKDHGNATQSCPELILNNFESQGGQKIGRLLTSLYPTKPDFLGRQAVTYHNQRDFIFVRRHRYIFDEDGSRASIQEIGPRFTLKLYFISSTLQFTDCKWSYHNLKKEIRKLNAMNQHSMDNKLRMI